MSESRSLQRAPDRTNINFGSSRALRDLEHTVPSDQKTLKKKRTLSESQSLRRMSEAVVARQMLLGELRRDTTNSVTLHKSTAAEPQLQRESRKAHREAFLTSRQVRHNEACDAFEHQMDILGEQCQSKAQDASKEMRQHILEANAEIDRILHPLEGGSDHLAEKTHSEVQNIAALLEEVTDRQKSKIDEFCAELGQIDGARREESVRSMRSLAETLTSVAHAVPGEVERIIEQKTLQLNVALIENQKSVKTLCAKLTKQTLEKIKDNKMRWNGGLLLWKQKRHRHTMACALQRMEGNQFREPAVLMEIVTCLQEHQRNVFEWRSNLVAEFFDFIFTNLPDLTASTVKQWDERSSVLNDRIQESCDTILVRLKEAEEQIHNDCEEMSMSLGKELEMYDAVQEWGEHKTVIELVNAEIRPKLEDNLHFVSSLVRFVEKRLPQQEEAQHSEMSRLIVFFLMLAQRQESVKKHMDELEVQYQVEVEDCEKSNEEACVGHETEMLKLHRDMKSAVDLDTLNQLKEQAFECLKSKESDCEEHSDELKRKHIQYQENVASFLRAETVGFCSDLGLVMPSAQEEEDDGDGQLVEWTGRSGVYVCKPVAQMREDILATPASVQDQVQAVPANDGVSHNDVKLDVGSSDMLRLSNGDPILKVLHFDALIIEKGLENVRKAAFEYMDTCEAHLKRIDVDQICEQIFHNCNQQLCRHSTRYDEVDAMWYTPRCNIIAKHKDKFERWLAEVERKFKAHDDAILELFTKMKCKGEKYAEGLHHLQSRFAEAETLPMLSAYERKAGDMARAFKGDNQQIREKVSNMKVLQALQKESKAFLLQLEQNIGDGGVERFSLQELRFYTSKIERLNASLDERARAREEEWRELELQLEEKCRQQCKEFTENFDVAVQQLCATKGYGKEYGAPRQRAQQKSRTLIASVEKVQENLHDLFAYLEVLCRSSSVGVVEMGSLPPSPLPRLQEMIQQTGSVWVFTSELIGVLYILVCALAYLGKYLGAFKKDKENLYRLEGVPLVSILCETSSTAPEDHRNAEQALRNSCLEKVVGELLCVDPFNARAQSVGELLSVEPFNARIQTVVEESQSHDTYGSKDKVPEFMQRYLAGMQTAADHARHEAALGVREKANALRESTLLCFGDVLFGELGSRFLRNLHQCTEQTQVASLSTWEALDAAWVTHERQLGPQLANPKKSAQFDGLIEDEALRYQKTCTMIDTDRAGLVDVLRKEADAFTQCLSAKFEAACLLVDALPLHSHFANLPGDEEEEPERISIKRRMRRRKSGASMNPGDGLPVRQWEGVPKYELHMMLQSCGGLLQPELSALPPEAREETTTILPSYRSPVHKMLFKLRVHHYEKYKSEFAAEVNRLSAELTEREQKESARQRNWQSMIRQLKGEVIGASASMEREGVLDEPSETSFEMANKFQTLNRVKR